MEFIVRLFRVLANYRRIKLARLLAVLGEMSVSQLARATRNDLPHTSVHLHAMASVGIVWPRRSGRRVWYRLADRPGNALTTAVLELLRQAFRGVSARAPRQVARADQRASPAYSDRAMFASFTAFTHPRRLQIIRHLFDTASGSAPTLAATLSMSRPACSRHLDKLVRRGILRKEGSRRQRSYLLAPGAGPVRSALLTAVLSHLDRPAG